ncbi:putative benzoate 4-monooxygenase cytochrome P450 [Amylocarpus encephaloides]|uniref:Benzoate 4-monooxygenase cytochrome P450 n=1 Tax=Amylocarpus encephaloides TaxID=45428 RepID=A0A9P7YQ64_9HELO|nr:putative benzoate 4-monooxygenase cytochrome P450 [Amylocarpus encephaloides]
MCFQWLVDNRLIVIAVVIVVWWLIAHSRFHSRIPGPRLYAISRWRLAYDDLRGTRTQTIQRLHQRYGPVVRVGPRELSFNSLAARRTIYGAGSGFERTSFYRMFDVYGHQNLFTFATPKEHSDRKKLLSHAYSKSNIIKRSTSAIQQKTWEFMQMIDKEPKLASEIFTSLHYYSLDNITHFLYGSSGATSALIGDESDRALLTDVLDPARRKLAWHAVHFPRYTKWLLSQSGWVEKAVNSMGLMPQRKPTVYTGIRQHALKSWMQFSSSSDEEKVASKTSTIAGYLWESQSSRKERRLSGLGMASEVADHLLAGVDTTADTLMFLVWALSLPENAEFQERLIKEVANIPVAMLDSNGIPIAEATDKLPFLDAVIKETLRLYSPLPASEPRSLPIACVIDGYQVAASEVVSMSPYTLHRNPKVFPDPLVFNPNRWLEESDNLVEMKKWFWAFSSGARMCIGIHLAMAEMTILTAALYQKYATKVPWDLEHTSPGITSRFEVFYDESKRAMEEHLCHIRFQSLT